jgi:hypothetical protein
VQQSGRKALAQHLDPYDWKPFEYVEANKGFVLRSQLKNGSDLLIIKVGAVE